MNILQKTDAVFLPAIEEFLAIFNHRYDYIHSPQGIQPQWKTESRHPLHNNLIKQAASIYGVRFGTTTNYAMIDIDSGSPYHPRSDRLAIARMIAALEPLGIVSSVMVSSSYSRGLHIYLPLDGNFKSWTIASAIDALLTAAGFSICKGWLEIFPNNRTSPDQLYAAHRLPMQAGSYVLNDDFEPVAGDHGEFVRHWNWAQARNEVSQKKLDHVLKFYQRRTYSITKKGAKFLQDLDAEIELGWTGHGQTNTILGRIVTRGRVFGHILEGTDEPLTLRQLIKYTVATAKSLPGYDEWCRHIPEIDRKAEMWARSAIAKYWPYAIGKSDSPAADDQDLRSSNPWNQLQRELARDRIRYAVYELLDQGTLPEGVLARQDALRSYGIGADSLYTNLELWHPRVICEERLINDRAAIFGVGGVPGGHSKGSNLGNKNFPDDPNPENQPYSRSSLLPKKGGDLPPDRDHRRSDPPNPRSIGGDLLPSRRFNTDT